MFGLVWFYFCITALHHYLDDFGGGLLPNNTVQGHVSLKQFTSSKCTFLGLYLAALLVSKEEGEWP